MSLSAVASVLRAAFGTSLSAALCGRSSGCVSGTSFWNRGLGIEKLPPSPGQKHQPFPLHQQLVRQGPSASQMTL